MGRQQMFLKWAICLYHLWNFEIPHFKQDVEQQWRELYEEMEKQKEAEEAKKKREKQRAKQEDIWGLDEEDEEENEEDAEEEAEERPKQEGSAERASLDQKEAHFEQKDEL